MQRSVPIIVLRVGVGASLDQSGCSLGVAFRRGAVKRCGAIAVQGSE